MLSSEEAAEALHTAHSPLLLKPSIWRRLLKRIQEVEGPSRYEPAFPQRCPVINKANEDLGGEYSLTTLYAQ